MIHIRWKAVNAYQVNQQTSLNPIASPEPGSRAGLKRNRVERRYKFMKCKRLSAAILSLVMIISLLPTTALAAEENDVWSKEYGTIRVYLDSDTEEDYKNLEGNQVRIMSEKYHVKDGDGKGMRVCGRIPTEYWYTTNAAEGIMAKDIDSVVLAKNNIGKPSDKISIPIEGNTKYKVTVSEGKDILIKYLCIEITKREPHTVEYKFSGIADVDYPTSVTLPASEQATATTKVTLPDVTTPITGTLNGKDGIWTFKGWALPDGVTFTDDTHTKFTMPDTNVTVTGTWTFEATPPTGTPVYVYFQTVDTAGNPIGDKDHENVKGVKHNENGSGWATLGKLVTATAVTIETALGNEINDNNSNFTRYTPNSGLSLSLIKSWGAPHKENGAADYVKFGTEAWHLDGKVNVYRAIYCDSDGTELEGFTPNQTPEYYLKGATDIALTKEVPDVPGKVFDGWVTNDVTVENNAFNMPGKDVTFTAKWKPGALKIEKILDDNSPAAEKTFSFTVTPGVEPVQIKGKGSKTISDLPVGSYTVTENSSTAAVDGYRCTTQYKTAGSTWQDTPIPVSVASNSTVTVYVKNSYTPITADLIDDDITIKHGVNGDPEHGNDTDTTAHIVEKNAKISYQATLDMQSLKFGTNPEHADTVFKIKTLMQDAGTTSLWEFMKGKDITMFAGSTVNLYVKFDENLNVTKGSFDNIKLTSDWFQLDKTHSDYLSQEAGGYWKIPCVIKAEKGTNNSSIITLSGITLPLTADAQGKLNSNTALDIISEGYIDGTIMIFMQALKLEGKSKEAPAKNTAKLKLAVPTYTVTYIDGVNGSAFKDQVYPGLKSGVATPAFNGTPTRSGYTFNGWTPAVAKTVTGDATYTATWSQNSSHDDDDDKYYFAIQKIDAQDGHALNGAKFELYQLDKNDRIVNRRVVRTTQQSSKSGIALFGVDNKNSYDGIWYYAEVSAPEGYVLDRTEYEINHKDFSDSLSAAIENADTVRNYRGTTPDLLNDSDHFAYVIGYMDGNVRPYGLISRAETTTIFFRLLKDSVRDGNLLTSNTYTDVADDYWANTAISTMTGLGIVQGRSTTTFDPKAPITRAQFAAICARFDTGKSNGEQTFSDISGHWAEKYIQRAAELGWIKGFEDGTFRPDTYITRAQAMTMINRVLNRIPEDESDLLPGMNVWPDCNPGDWFYLAVQEATNSHDFEHKAGNYETWTKLMKNPDWTRYEN